MKLSIPQPTLAGLVAKGGSVAPKSSPAPIVTNVRLTAAGGFLLVASTDMDRYAEAKGVAAVEAEGDITVPAAALAALVARLPRDKEVSLEMDGAHLIVKCGRSRSKLPTLPADLFQSWIDGEGGAAFTMTGADFVSAFSSVRPMTNPTGLTYAMLQGVHVAIGGSVMQLAGTNRNMVGFRRFDLEDLVAETAVTIPNETVDTALRMFKGEEEVTISISQHKAEFSNHALRLGSKLIADPFPMAAICGFFTSPVAASLSVSRLALIESVERAKLGAEAEGQLAVVILIPRGGELEVKGYNLTGGEVRDAVEAEIGDDFAFAAFDPRYLLTVLSGLPDDEIEIRQIASSNGERINHLFACPARPEFTGLVAAVRSNEAMAA